MARQRDYRAEYQRRKERAAEQGTTPRKLRDSRAAEKGNPRDYQLERERREIRARGRGFTGLAEERRYRATGRAETPSAIEAWRRTNILAKFGITKRRFDQIRRENREHTDYYGLTRYNDINRYNYEFDAEIHNWSEERVGYIVSYHGAIVNPNTNYDSLLESHTTKDAQGNRKRTRTRKLTRNGKPLSNAEQFFYLVKYTGLMTVNEFEQRYGNRAVAEARAQGVPEP